MREASILLFLVLGACAAPGEATVGGASVAATRPEHVGGDVLTDWRVVDMDGREHDLAATLDSGRRVALVFWQTWCRSCREEFPGLVRSARAHADEILFLGVISGPDEYVDDAEVRRVASDARLPYPQVRDRDLALTSGLEVEGTPTIIVLGEGRRVVYRGNELPDWAGLLR